MKHPYPTQDVPARRVQGQRLLRKFDRYGKNFRRSICRGDTERAIYWCITETFFPWKQARLGSTADRRKLERHQRKELRAVGGREICRSVFTKLFTPPPLVNIPIIPA